MNPLAYETLWNVFRDGIRNNIKSVRKAPDVSSCILGHCQRTCKKCSRCLHGFIPSQEFKPCPMKMYQHLGTELLSGQ